VGECFFWYRPTRVVPDQRPLNGRRQYIVLEDFHFTSVTPLFIFLLPLDLRTNVSILQAVGGMVLSHYGNIPRLDLLPRPPIVGEMGNSPQILPKNVMMPSFGASS